MCTPPEFSSRQILSDVVRFCHNLFPSKPVVRAIEVSHAACKDEFRKNPRSHSCRFLLSVFSNIRSLDKATAALATSEGVTEQSRRKNPTPILPLANPQDHTEGGMAGMRNTKPTIRTRKTNISALFGQDLAKKVLRREFFFDRRLCEGGGQLHDKVALV